jgi:hypothetical protein
LYGINNYEVGLYIVDVRKDLLEVGFADDEEVVVVDSDALGAEF